MFYNIFHLKSQLKKKKYSKVNFCSISIIFWQKKAELNVAFLSNNLSAYFYNLRILRVKHKTEIQHHELNAMAVVLKQEI